MFCDKCGKDIPDNQTACPACGAPKGPSPGRFSRDLRSERAIARLGRFWLLFAGINIVLGAMGLFAVQTALTSGAGPWEPWPHPPLMEWTLIGAGAWTLLLARIAASFAAGFGLLHHADWARPVAFLAALAAITQFPIGLVLGAYTLVELLNWGNRPLHREVP